MKTKGDPWQLKEEERARFQKRRETESTLAKFKSNQRPLGFILCLLFFIASGIPAISPFIRLLLTGVGAISIIGLLAIHADIARIQKKSFWQLPQLLFVLSLVSGIISFYIAPNRGLAMGELLRLVAGASAYLYTACALRGRREIVTVLSGITIIGGGIALYDISHFAQLTGFSTHMDPSKVSAFGTHESVGSLLAILLVLTLPLSLVFNSQNQYKVAAQSISLIIAFAWIIVRCRSAWIGGSIGICILIFLLIYFKTIDLRKKSYSRNSWISDIITSPLFIIAGALIFLGLTGGIAPLLLPRIAAFNNLLEDSSFNSRLEMWNGALRMLSERPIFGWGLGAYLLMQGEWTHLGDSAQQVLLFGTGHQNIAHNYYVQWAAETGCVGLLIYIYLLYAILTSGILSIKSKNDKCDKAILCGVIASLFCGVIEVFSSPAFQFSGVWVLFWSIAGLSVSLNKDDEPKIPLKSAVLGMLVSVILVFVFFMIGKWAWDPRGEGRGVFEITEMTTKPYTAGKEIRWRASYRDSSGKICSTFPGTQWDRPYWSQEGQNKEIKFVLNEDITLKRAPFSASDLLQGYSELEIRIPMDKVGMMSIQAFYRDRFGRNYSAMRVITVEK